LNIYSNSNYSKKLEEQTRNFHIILYMSRVIIWILGKISRYWL